MADGDGGLGGTLGTLIVAGAVLGMMNKNNRTRTVTKTRYVTKTKPKYLVAKPKKVMKKRKLKAPASFLS
jgi:hypothetical protein